MDAAPAGAGPRPGRHIPCCQGRGFSRRAPFTDRAQAVCLEPEAMRVRRNDGSRGPRSGRRSCNAHLPQTASNVLRKQTVVIAITVSYRLPLRRYNYATVLLLARQRDVTPGSGITNRSTMPCFVWSPLRHRLSSEGNRSPPQPVPRSAKNMVSPTGRSVPTRRWTATARHFSVSAYIAYF